MVIMEMLKSDENRSIISFITDEARELVKFLPDVKIQKVDRDCNLAAHRLASFGRFNWSDGMLLNTVPPCVLEQPVQLDRNERCNNCFVSE